MTQTASGRSSVEISATVPDWSREAKSPFQWAPDRSLLAAIRSYQRVEGQGPIAAVRRMIAVMRHRFWSAVTGADIPINCQIGGGLRIPHPNGIVVHGDAVIGPNCLLMQRVTLGTNGKGVPRLCGHVDIGVGASILGPITIGDHARIGAHALVLKDIPAGAVVLSPLAQIRESQAN